MWRINGNSCESCKQYWIVLKGYKTVKSVTKCHTVKGNCNKKKVGKKELSLNVNCHKVIVDYHREMKYHVPKKLYIVNSYNGRKADV